MGNLDLYDKFRSVPNEAKKPIQAGRLKGKTDINPMWRIKALTEAFGPCGIGWYYKTVNKWMERQGEEVAAFVDIELFPNRLILNIHYFHFVHSDGFPRICEKHFVLSSIH